MHHKKFKIKSCLRLYNVMVLVVVRVSPRPFHAPLPHFLRPSPSPPCSLFTLTSRSSHSLSPFTLLIPTRPSSPLFLALPHLSLLTASSLSSFLSLTLTSNSSHSHFVASHPDSSLLFLLSLTSHFWQNSHSPFLLLLPLTHLNPPPFPFYM